MLHRLKINLLIISSLVLLVSGLAMNQALAEECCQSSKQKIAKRNYQPTVLYKLIHKKDEEVILKLLDDGYDLSQEKPDILQDVARYEMVKVIQKLMEMGLDINKRFYHGTTSIIHTAAANKTQGLCAFLLEQNPAFIDSVDISGRRPIHIATSHGNLELVQLFLDKGAKIDVLDKKHNTPLFLAEKNRSHKVAALLIANGAGLKHKDGFDRSLLFYTIKTKNQNLTQRLLRSGADVNHKGTLGNTPLMYAAFYGNADAAFLLLNSKEADVNERNNIGESALIVAAGRGHLDVVKLLLKHGADINTKTSITGMRFRALVTYDGKKRWEHNGSPYSKNHEPGHPQIISGFRDHPPNTVVHRMQPTTKRIQNKDGSETIIQSGSATFVAIGAGPVQIGMKVKPGKDYVDDTALSRARRNQHKKIVRLLDKYKIDRGKKRQ